MFRRWVLLPLAVLFVLLVLLVVILVALRPAQNPPVAIDFTRHLSHHTAASGTSTASFVGTPGDARIQVTCSTELTGLGIEVNGQPLLTPDAVSPCADGLEIPVVLTADNTITVFAGEPMQGAASVRIKQRTDIQLHVLSRVHFNTNVSDFAAARAFYGKLGFTTLSGFPDTNTQAMAQAIGIETPTTYDGSKGDWAGGYLLHGELIGLGFMSGAIDLIEFTIPRNESPPYSRLNHLGMARATLHTTNLDADHAYLSSEGVNFLSPPVERSDGTRFAIFTDPDGTFYELAEIPGPTGTDEQRTTHINGFGPLTVNTSDFERSRAWYQMFGYELSRRLPATDSIDVAKAMGFDAPFQIDGAILTHVVDGSTMELTQWLEPHDPERAYPIPVNHLGIHRTALTTTDIAADVATLKAQGVEFLSPVTPCCSGPDASGAIVAFYDPDGTIVELVEQPVMSWVMPSLLQLRDSFR